MVHARVQDYESRCSYCRLINRLIHLNSIVFWRSFMIYAILYDHHSNILTHSNKNTILSHPRRSTSIVTFVSSSSSSAGKFQ